MPRDITAPEHSHYVSIEYFIYEMMGFTSRSTYYNHRDDEGWPKRVYPTGKPMLVYEECVAFQKRLEANRVPPGPYQPPKRTPRRGRPPKITR